MKTPVRLMMAAVVLVLIITCANLANLLLARANSRQHEIAIRESLRGTHVRILQQFLTENWLLGLIGGAIGVELASGGIHALLSWTAARLPRGSTINVDVPVLLFAIGLSFFTVLVFGWVPTAGLSRIDLNQSLRTGRSEVGGSGRRGFHLFAIWEIAGSVVLMAAAALLLRSFWEATHVDPGFEPQHLLTAYLRHSHWDRISRYLFRQALDRVAVLPRRRTCRSRRLRSRRLSSGYSTWIFRPIS